MKLIAVIFFLSSFSLFAETISVGCGEQTIKNNEDGTATAMGADYLFHVDMVFNGVDYYYGKFNTVLLNGNKFNVTISRYKKSKYLLFKANLDMEGTILISSGENGVDIGFQAEKGSTEMMCSVIK